MAKSTLGSLLISLELETATLNKQVNKVNKRFDGMTKTFKKAGVALAGAFAVRGLTTMIKNTLSLGDSLGKVADRLGLTATELQQLHFAAEQSGIATSELEISLQRMTRRLSDAAKGSGTAVKTLKELGLEAENLGKMTPNEQLEVLADALQGVESEADKVRIAFSLFDSGGVKLLTMLKDGSAGLKEYANEADKLGFIIDRQMIGMMEAANDSMNKLSKVSDGMKNTLTVALAPAITAVADTFIDWVTQGEGANGMLKKLHAGIRSTLQAIDVLNETISLSVTGWKLLGGSVELLAESWFGTAEGIKRAEDNLLAMTRVADTQFVKAVKVFDEGGDLVEKFDINLGALSVTADKAGNSFTKLADTATKSTQKMKEVITDSQKAIEHVFTNSFSNMENSIVDFAKTGKFAFKDFAESILEDLLRMVVQLQITIPLMNALKASMAGGGMMSIFGFAQGGVFSGGSVTPFASGGVVSSPTVFPMANGMGLMGEAGAEAIMPLTRTAGGDLGVKAVGGGGGTIVNIYNQSNNEAEVTESSNGDGQKTIDIMIKASVERSIGSGSMDRTFNSNYGLNRRGY